MGPKTFKIITDFLWKERKNICRGLGWYSFDYPDYGGLPKRVSSRLSSDAVDGIQETLYAVSKGEVRDKRLFRRKLLYNLRNSGEKVLTP